MLRTVIILIAALLYAFPSQAGINESTLEHARNAFIFADKQNWPEARAHAKASHDNALIALIDWRYILDQDSGASFDEISYFIENHHNWPEQRRLRLRAEFSLRDGLTDDSEILAWFDKEVPLSGIGKMALVSAMQKQGKGDPQLIATLVREAWQDGDFDASQEKAILSSYSNFLTSSDHIKRTDRLLWEGKIKPAQRMFSHVSADYKRLFEARIALQEYKKNAAIPLRAVPSSLRKNAGLIYDRMRYKAHRNDTQGVRDMLFAMPAGAPYPEKWWRYREWQVREAIDEKQYSLARKLLAKHGAKEGVSFADATWLSGWLQCEFLNQPKNAYSLFYRMYDAVSYPVSRARAAYWAGHAASKMGNDKFAEKWFTVASQYPTTFYGQLATQKLGKNIVLPSAPTPDASAAQRFDNNDVVRAAIISAEAGEHTIASKLIAFLVEEAPNDTEALLAASLGKRLGNNYLSVRGAKKAMQRNIVLTEAAYPQLDTPEDVSIERALTLAISRQESEFDERAKSPSGALGMMQLLPSTAKETAKKNDLPYGVSRLYEPEYNMTLGSLYLGRLINAYDDSYIMGIASYNAGPGNVRKWTQRFGTPGNKIDAAVNWIEKIPFSETRNYVQRVLENVQVYRYLESGGRSDLKLEEDLTR